MTIFNESIKLLGYIAGTTFLLAAASANAAAMTFIDKVDPNPDKLISFGNNLSYSFSHSIISDQDGTGAFWSGTYGFNPLTDIITSASIALDFKDESTDIASESVQLVFDAQSFGTQMVTSGGATYAATISGGWDTLLNDGILNVTLQNAGTTSGHQDDRSDFLFLESTLTVDVRREGQTARQIPEPASLPLVFLGLAGAAFSRRKQAGLL